MPGRGSVLHTVLGAAALAAASLSAAGPAAAQTAVQPAPAGSPLGADAFITLGTMGGPVADGTRAQPANVLVHGGQAILVDAGDGAVGQLSKAGIPLPAITAVFLSHLHMDHAGGLLAVLGLRDQTDVRGPLAIHGPPGTRALVAGLVTALQGPARTGYGIPGQPWPAPDSIVSVTELADGQTVKLGDVTVRAAQNTHYDFAAGSADDQAAKSLSFRFDVPGRSIVYTGDTGPSAAVETLARGADLLVSEMIDIDVTMARVARVSPAMPAQAKGRMVQHLTTHHLTPADVGQLASRAGVKAVVVTHVAGGIPDPALVSRYSATIGGAFKGPVTIANDLDRF